MQEYSVEVINNGNALGQAFVHKGKVFSVNKKSEIDLTIEVKILHEAIKACKNEYLMLSEKTLESLPGEYSCIFDSLGTILEDKEYISLIEKNISENGLTAKTAIEKSLEEISLVFKTLDDEYIKERISDYKDVSDSLINHIYGKKDNIELLSDCVLFTDEISPEMILNIDRSKVKGVCVKRMGIYSHSAILLKGFSIPTFLVSEDFNMDLVNNLTVFADGNEKKLYIDISKDFEKSAYCKLNSMKSGLLLKDLLNSVKSKKTHLYLNAGLIEEAEKIRTFNGLKENVSIDGIGLLRTEYLYMQSDRLPSENEQYRFYKAIKDTIAGLPVVLRTLDAGLDKNIKCIGMEQKEEERGIAWCIKHSEVFYTQLRAAIRVNEDGFLRLMYPMVHNIEEVKAANAIRDKVFCELINEGISLEMPKTGIMVETVEACNNISKLIPMVDFVSIGTNDLLSELSNTDRVTDSKYKEDAIELLLEEIVKITGLAHKAGLMVSVCGDMASDPAFFEKFVDMGVDVLSINSSLI